MSDSSFLNQTKVMSLQELKQEIVDYREISPLGYSSSGSWILARSKNTGMMESYFISDINSTLGGTPTTSQAVLGANAATSSSTYNSTGFGLAVTPSGKSVLVLISASLSHTLDNGFGRLALYRTTAAIPSVNSAVVGSQLTTTGVSMAGANGLEGIPIVYYDSGLASGTYNYYLAFLTTSGVLTLAAQTDALSAGTQLVLQQLS
jgi:hypothetical protein